MSKQVILGSEARTNLVKGIDKLYIYKMLQQEGEHNVNTYRLAVKYGCYETNTL